MGIEEILKNAFKVKEIKPDAFQIKTGAILPNKKPLYCFVNKTTKGYIISDKKYIMSYMNDLYMINSSDVKQCISGVVIVNKTSIIQGNLVKEVKDESELISGIFDFIISAFQLVNMYVFFDPPDKH